MFTCFLQKDEPFVGCLTSKAPNLFHLRLLGFTERWSHQPNLILTGLALFLSILNWLIPSQTISFIFFIILRGLASFERLFIAFHRGLRGLLLVFFVVVVIAESGQTGRRPQRAAGRVPHSAPVLRPTARGLRRVQDAGQLGVPQVGEGVTQNRI